MDQTAIVDGGSGANAHLRPQGGGRYGNVNQLAWSADGRQVEVWITTGFTLLGDELVVPSSFVTDVAGNRAVGTQVLLGKDSVAPEITAVAFDDADGSGTVSLGDRWRFHFSEPMRTLGLTDGTTEANRNLSPAGARYGTLNRIEWSADAMAATLWVTTGYTVAGGELVSPSASLTDRAGNPLANTALLTLTDSIAPRVRQVQAKYISPVSAVDDYELAIQFDSSMDPFSEPVLALSSSGGVDPLIPTGGTWLTTSVPNDTYSTPPILLDASMDGLLTLDVSGAADWAGNPMAPAAGVFTVELDGTPPPNPQVSVAALGCDHADLNWTGYPDPGDLAGFQVYRRDDGPFSLVDGVSFIQLIGPSARALRLAGLDFDVPYQVAIVAMDDLGNITNVVDSVPISIDRVIPAAVLPTVGPGNDPDTAVLDWSSYDSSSQCGFAGFRVYRETAPFDDVTGLTPIQTLAPETRDLHVEGLDRDSDYWFAVVGINGADEFDSSVTAVRWSDPYAGDIRTDTTIGAGEQRELAIAETMQVRDGATLTIEPGTRLYFAAGTGIEVIDGRLLALGTALDPIRLASELELNGGTPAPGDWTGIRIGAGDDGSELAHITIDHATDAVRLDAAGASVTALTARYASGAGLALDNGAILTTDAALLVQNATGALATAGSQLSIGGSVLKGNGLNADLDGTSVLTATGNWWGSPDPATIAAGVTVGVQTGVADGDYLDSEPVLTPAIELADALDQVTTRNLTLRLAGRLAEEMRISEDSSFYRCLLRALRQHDRLRTESGWRRQADLCPIALRHRRRSRAGERHPDLSNRGTGNPELQSVRRPGHPAANDGHRQRHRGAGSDRSGTVSGQRADREHQRRPAGASLGSARRRQRHSPRQIARSRCQRQLRQRRAQPDRRHPAAAGTAHYRSRRRPRRRRWHAPGTGQLRALRRHDPAPLRLCCRHPHTGRGRRLQLR